MKKLLIFLLFTFSVYFCFADVIVQQKNFSGVPNYSSILNFNQFDPSNGTLTSVNVELSVSITNFSAIVDNDGVDSSFVDLELGAKGTISSDDVTLLDASLHSVAGPVTTWTGRHYDLAPNEGDGSEDYDSSPPDGASYSGTDDTNNDAGDVGSSFWETGDKGYIGTSTYDITAQLDNYFDTGGAGGVEYAVTPGTANGYVKITYTYDPPLAVELSSFTAYYNGDTTCLSWTTQTETSNLGWDIFRSETENLNEAIKVNVSLVPGAGTTFEPTDYNYVDYYPIQNGVTYFYWVIGKDASGITDNFGPVAIDIPQHHNQNPNPPEIYTQNYYLNNFPNPFNRNTTVRFMVKEAGTANISIYNIKGQKIVTLLETPISYDNLNKIINCPWNGKDENDRLVSDGIYLTVLNINGKIHTKHMILVR